jgi:hypothetical protein
MAQVASPPPAWFHGGTGRGFHPDAVHPREQAPRHPQWRHHTDRMGTKIAAAATPPQNRPAVGRPTGTAADWTTREGNQKASRVVATTRTKRSRPTEVRGAGEEERPCPPVAGRDGREDDHQRRAEPSRGRTDPIPSQREGELRDASEEERPPPPVVTPRGAEQGAHGPPLLPSAKESQTRQRRLIRPS